MKVDLQSKIRRKGQIMTEKTNNPCLIVGCSDRVWGREFQNRFHLEIIVKNVKFFKISDYEK